MEKYPLLLTQLEQLLSLSKDAVCNMANMSSFLFNQLENLNWAGFYILRGETLLLGPFQGKPACVRIALGKGVCGTAAQNRQTQVVADVHRFAGHIACDSASQSEIVIPILKGSHLWGVLDIDSPLLNRFSKKDQQFLEQTVAIFTQATCL